MDATNSTYSTLSSFIDETFDVRASNNYHLSLEISFSGLSAAVLDTARNKYILLENHFFQRAYSPTLLISKIQQLLSDKEYLSKNYQSIAIGFYSEKFTFVPGELIENTLLENYLSLSNRITTDETIMSAAIKPFGSHCVFAMDKGLLLFLTHRFPNAKFVHSFNSLLESINSISGPQNKKNVLIHMQQGHFEMIVTENKKLIFANSFSYQTSEDFLYHTLFVLEQLQLNTETTELMLTGEVEKNSAIYSILKKYINSIHFIDKPELFEYSYSLNNLPNNFHFNLYSLALCV